MTWLRTRIETWSRDRVLRRRLPGELGGRTLFVSPDASLRYLRRDLSGSDEGLFGLARELVRPGERVWDLGANVGLFTFAAAHLAGPEGSVLAVEADAWLAALLRRTESGSYPGAARVSVLCAAASDTDGFADFAIANRGRSTNHLTAVAGSTQTGGSRAVHPVTTARLDSLLNRFGAPTLVKMDVEGAEALCLRGGHRLLTEARPHLVCEVSEANADAVTEILLSHSYRLFDASKPAVARRQVRRATWATLALPMSTDQTEAP